MMEKTWGQRVKLQHLRVVLAVAENASLVRASGDLGLTQPAITKIIHEVETELGVQLFVRTSRGTHCTAFGRILAEHARLVFTQLDAAAAEIHDAREGLSGRVVVGALIAGAAAILPRALARLHHERPGVRVTVIEGTYDYLTPLLRQGALDFIVGRLPAHQFREGLVVEPMCEEAIAFVVRDGHPALGRGRCDLAELRAWPWILPLPDTTMRRIIESAFHGRNLELPQAPCESVSVVSNRRMLMDTDFICAFPLEVIQPDLDTGLLRRLPLKHELSFGPVGVSRRRTGSLSRAAEALIQAMRDSAVAQSCSQQPAAPRRRTERPA